MSESLLGHLPYCDSSCFQDHPTSSTASIRPPISLEVDGFRPDYAPDDNPVLGTDLGCSICAKHREAVGFFLSLRTCHGPIGADVDNTVVEATDRSTKTSQPLVPSSLDGNSATGLSFVRCDSLDTSVVKGINHLLDEVETKTPSDLHEDCPGNSNSLLAYGDFILYEEPSCLENLHLPLFEEECITPEVGDDGGSLSDDNHVCYCGCCWPFIAPDSPGQQGSLWGEDWAEEGLAMAA
jgi:hypothetical protein